MLAFLMAMVIGELNRQFKTIQARSKRKNNLRTTPEKNKQALTGMGMAMAISQDSMHVCLHHPPQSKLFIGMTIQREISTAVRYFAVRFSEVYAPSLVSCIQVPMRDMLVRLESQMMVQTFLTLLARKPKSLMRLIFFLSSGICRHFVQHIVDVGHTKIFVRQQIGNLSVNTLLKVYAVRHC